VLLSGDQGVDDFLGNFWREGLMGLGNVRGMGRDARPEPPATAILTIAGYGGICS
jgi:hypothetical protein